MLKMHPYFSVCQCLHANTLNIKHTMIELSLVACHVSFKFKVQLSLTNYSLDYVELSLTNLI